MKIIKTLVIYLIKFYQAFSALWPARCRYYPSCSEYTKQAVQYNGVIKGIIMGAKRILRCHPFHKGGYDPVPRAIGINEDGSIAEIKKDYSD